MPDIANENRRRARELVASDINAARQLLPTDFAATDPQRIARALEVFFQTGHHLSEYQRTPRIGAILPTPHRILINPAIDVLRGRIAARIPRMISGGAMDEARRIISAGLNENRAIGAAQLCRMLRGEITRTAAIENWITKTNQYAKRQRTWFRTQFVADEEINTIAMD